MTFDGKHIWLTFADLLEYQIPEKTLKSGLMGNRSGAKSWIDRNDPEDKRRVLVRYDSIPSQTKEKYGLPGKSALIMQAKAASHKQAIAGLWRLHAAMLQAGDGAALPGQEAAKAGSE